MFHYFCSLPGRTHAMHESLEVKFLSALVLSKTWHHILTSTCASIRQLPWILRRLSCSPVGPGSRWSGGLPESLHLFHDETPNSISSFRRQFQLPCREPIPMRSFLLIVWRLRPRAARTYRSNRIGRGHRISRSWSTWHHLTLRFNVLCRLYSCAATGFEVQISLIVRSWLGVGRPTLFEAIRNSPIGSPPTSLEPNQLPAVCHSTLNDIADLFEPLHSVQSRICPLSTWLDADCRYIRRNCRRLNKYRRTKDVDDKLAWIKSVWQKHRSFRAKENSHWVCMQGCAMTRRGESRQSCGSRDILYYACIEIWTVRCFETLSCGLSEIFGTESF